MTSFFAKPAVMAFGALLAVSIAAPAASAQSVDEGIEAWQAGNHQRAVQIWRPLAMRGDADAAFNLGQAYRLGRGVPPNLGEAQRLFEQAANKGHVEAQTNLGLIMFNNGDRAGAMRWLREAALGNEPRAMLVYGTALFNGEGVAQDRIAAYAYVLRSARAGLGPAQATLAEMNSLLPVEVRQAGRELAERQGSEAAPAPVQVAEAPPPAPPPAPEPAPPPPLEPEPEPEPVMAAAPEPPAPTPASSDGPWRLQLGAFSNADGARTLWSRLEDHPALMGKRAFYVPAGGVTRLHVGGFRSRAGANAACSKLKADGQACFALRP